MAAAAYSIYSIFCFDALKVCSWLWAEIKIHVKLWQNKNDQTFVWCSVFPCLFLQQAADANSKKDMQKTSITTKDWPFLFGQGFSKWVYFDIESFYFWWKKSLIIFGQILKNPTLLLHTGFMLWSDMYHSALATVSLISICSSWSN